MTTKDKRPNVYQRGGVWRTRVTIAGAGRIVVPMPNVTDEASARRLATKLAAHARATTKGAK